MSDPERTAHAPWVRTLAALERHAVDWLLLSRAANGTFVSGARRVQIGGSGGFVPWVIARAGEPAPWVYTPDLDGVPAWIGDRARPMAWSPTRLLDDLTRLRRGRARRLAFDALSPRFLEALAARFPGAEWVDAEPLLVEARASRSAAEVEALAAAAGVASRALERVALEVRPGATGGRLAAFASAAAVAEGATFLAREAGVRVTSAGAGGAVEASARPVRDGDLVTIEVAVFVGAVQGEAARTVVAGHPGRAAEALLGRVEDALDALAGACRAGAEGLAIVRTVPAGVAGTPFLLHGIGAGAEGPFLDPAAPDGFRLLAGSTVVATVETSEEGVGTAGGSRTFLVGDGGSRRLDPEGGR